MSRVRQRSLDDINDGYLVCEQLCVTTTELKQNHKLPNFGILDQMGYEIEIIKINEFNRVTIEMYDREVFRCDIRNLMFNMTAEDDPVCQRAVKAVEEAKFRMCTDQNIPVYDSFSKGRRELVTEPVNRQSLQEAQSSNTDMYDIHNQGFPSTKIRSSVSDNGNKMEEKVGKVTIMEDKNTFMEEEQPLGENETLKSSE